ncbi:cytochrome c [Pseudomonas sp.]|uniref:c-type cytochrome n=1 Tax=Pseudomonas sp. TaxID=306 RepID=UPI00260CBE46|nr:cytochrome c [Pseudomonas sp.]
MRFLTRALLLIVALICLVLAVVLYYIANPNLPDYVPAEQVRYLDQWSEKDRQTFYFTPQGTQVKGLRYDWFGALELPFSDKRFATPEYLARFGFLVDPKQHATPANPGNLPVGFTQHQNPGSDERYLDITCAACHTGELRFKGQSLRIDGGSAHHVLPSSVPTLRGGSFGQALVASLFSTYYNPWKFERFARNVLGQNYDAQHEKLRSDFKQSLDTFIHEAWNDTHRGLYPTQEGPGRTDAFGRIANAALGDAISEKNYRVANAPVDYPQLWDIWKFDWVQWNGSAQQPMARNIGEALGVGATLTLFDAAGHPLTGDARYPSGARVTDLYTIEETLKGLKAPAWPEALLGNIDRPRAAQGKTLFADNCAGCHVPLNKPTPERPYLLKLKMLPVEYIGTDPNTADNIFNQRYDLSSLKWDPKDLAALNVNLVPTTDVPLDTSHVSMSTGLAYITAFVEARAYRDMKATPAEVQKLEGFGLPISVREARTYRARPLDGVWATPPFLHNGSVPSLYQLLSPQDERASTFYTGSVEFDPRHVGYSTEKFPGAFLFDTRISGNHNSGHEFRVGPLGNGVIGRLLQPEERWALVEYLKVLGGPLESQLP